MLLLYNEQTNHVLAPDRSLLAATLALLVAARIAAALLASALALVTAARAALKTLAASLLNGQRRRSWHILYRVVGGIALAVDQSDTACAEHLHLVPVSRTGSQGLGRAVVEGDFRDWEEGVGHYDWHFELVDTLATVLEVTHVVFVAIEVVPVDG